MKFILNPFHKNSQKGSVVILLILGVIVVFSMAIVSGASKFKYSDTQLIGTPDSGINPPSKPVSHFINASLTYNANSTTPILINEITAHETVTTPVDTAKVERTNQLYSEYSLQFLDSSNNVLFEKKFDVPNAINTDEGLFGGTGPSTIELDNLNFALSLPVIPSAVSLNIVDSSGNTVTQRTLPSEVTSLPAPPAFQTFSSGQVNIAFVSAQYSDSEMGLFSSDVQRIKSTLSTVAPYNELSGSINFVEVRNTSDLSCSVSRGRCVWCDQGKTAQAMANAGVTADTIMVIVNSPTVYGGCASIGGGFAVQSNDPNLGIVGTHELQHALIGLYDEYVYDGESGVYKGSGDLKNCYAGAPPAPSWKGVVGDDSYFQGCNNATNWYRSSEDSLMRSNTPYLNPLSIKYVKERFGVYTGGDNSGGATPTLTPTPKPNATATPTPTPKPQLDPPGVGWCANDTRLNGKSVNGGTCDIVNTAKWIGPSTNPYCVQKYPGIAEYYYSCEGTGGNDPTPTPETNDDEPVCTGPVSGPCAGCKNGVIGYLYPQCGEGDAGKYSSSQGGTYCGKNYYDVYLCGDGTKDEFPVPNSNSTCNSVPWCINGGSPTPTLGQGQPTATPIYSLECPSDGYHLCATSTTCDNQPGYSPKPSGNQACAEHFAGTSESNKTICCQKPK